ncbi:flagellar motor stator protein MotA [Alkalilimnicola ehrlichii MLHE-1]|uniref:Putative chemotaxis (Motility protein A) transmembrane n=1 Tax=Alkalilimnicola ehrlichii (strain ATCC BAA-1101 / DSM 17681 / MLHE-1) TaxID=187272 RepID=Q0A8I3_ALKEH|nr:flagellar motor stator protein MotA [Alkalilimnicola ehrlichii]ABI56854.1 putative chemotaxis (motility protein A) transmembrane [Alkalilimnicola ehrlichii MLHE-1]
MKLILGVIIVLVSVAVGYTAHGGNLAVLWQPFEVLIIFGAAGGAFLIANPMKVVKQVAGNVPRIMKGPPYRKQHYMDLLALLYEVFQKTQRDGLLSIEADVDNPHESELFRKYPSVLNDHEALHFLCDYLRLMVGGNMNPFELENLMDVELETHHQEAELPAHAVNRVADALPGFGIIAALLGIVIAMGEIDGPVQQIGSLVAAALIGTFIGILAGYSLVGPLGIAMEHRAREKAKYLEVIKVTIMAVLNGYKPVVAVEFGRKAMYEAERPSFEELENHVKGHNA